MTIHEITTPDATFLSDDIDNLISFLQEAIEEDEISFFAYRKREMDEKDYLKLRELHG